jgi:hypothetical protein
MSAFSLPIPPANLAVHLHWLTERSATAHYWALSFGEWLDPRYIFRAAALDQ